MVDDAVEAAVARNIISPGAASQPIVPSDELMNQLTRQRSAVITAEAPMYVPSGSGRPRELLTGGNLELDNLLRQRGMSTRPVLGEYDGLESSLLVTPGSQGEFDLGYILALGVKYGQESVLVGQPMAGGVPRVNLALTSQTKNVGGVGQPRVGLSEGTEALGFNFNPDLSQGYFSLAEVGGRATAFSGNINWGEYMPTKATGMLGLGGLALGASLLTPEEAEANIGFAPVAFLDRIQGHVPPWGKQAFPGSPSGSVVTRVPRVAAAAIHGMSGDEVEASMRAYLAENDISLMPYKGGFELQHSYHGPAIPLEKKGIFERVQMDLELLEEMNRGTANVFDNYFYHTSTARNIDNIMGTGRINPFLAADNQSLMHRNKFNQVFFSGLGDQLQWNAMLGAMSNEPLSTIRIGLPDFQRLPNADTLGLDFIGTRDVAMQNENWLRGAGPFHTGWPSVEYMAGGRVRRLRDASFNPNKFHPAPLRDIEQGGGLMLQDWEDVYKNYGEMLMPDQFDLSLIHISEPTRPY